MPAVHKKTKSQIIAFAIEQRNAGLLYELPDSVKDNDFFSSLDRFADIAVAFRNSPRVLDIGSGGGILVSLLAVLGHQAHAVDFFDRSQNSTYLMHSIVFKVCNIEADELPFPDAYFDAISCCQTFEHFTHSHLPPLMEMKRTLAPGGMIEIDVPNAACLRNRSRMLRGKHITWDYMEHYVHVEPSIYKGREYYPNRHNREFTRKELEQLFRAAGFSEFEVAFLRDERIRTGLSKLRSFGSYLRNGVPSLRKSLIGFAYKT
ncbi:MAG: methyltransferase domain-containing protein [Pseudomonadota bacterium]